MTITLCACGFPMRKKYQVSTTSTMFLEKRGAWRCWEDATNDHGIFNETKEVAVMAIY